MLLKKIFVAALLMMSVTVFGQDAWDLRRCIDYAREHNLQVNQQELAEKIANNNYLQSKLAVLPTLSGNAQVSRNFGRNIDYSSFQYIDAIYTYNNYSASSNLILFSGLRQVNNVKQNKLTAQATHYQTEAVKNNVMLNITQGYLGILQSQESLKALEEQVRISISQTEQAKQLLDAGTVPEGNVLRAQSQLAQDSLNLVTAQNNLEYSLVNLALLLQVDPQGFKVATPKISDDVPNLNVQGADGIYQYSLTSQPQILSSNFSELAAQKAVAIAKGFQSPTLSLFGQVNARYSSIATAHSFNPLDPDKYVDAYGKQLDNTFGQVVGLNLDVTIFNGWQVRNNIANAKVRYLQAQVTTQQTKDQLKQDIYRSYVDAKSAYQRFYAAQKNVAALQVTYDYAQNLFELGASNAVDYSTAKSNLAVGQVNMINAKYEYLFKLKVLDFYQGKTITLDNETSHP